MPYIEEEDRAYMSSLNELRNIARTMKPYCEYSNYPVRAAVATTYGAFFGGANYEVITFNQTMHAEHSAITAALNHRPDEDHKIITEVFVTTPNGGPPCGHCRQIIAEFAASPFIPIYIEQADLSIFELPLSSLLPYAFDDLS